MAQQLYLEAFVAPFDAGADKVTVTLETCVVLFVLEFVERPPNIQVFLIPSQRTETTKPTIEINYKSSNFTILSSNEFAAEFASNCPLPVLTNDNVIIAGLCSVCRTIVKFANESYRYLLGFKESCLLAPAEASPWTKFCEVDILACTKNVLMFHAKAHQNKAITDYILPKEFSQLESHLSQPVKAHNVGKLLLDFARSVRIDDTQNGTAKHEGNGFNGNGNGHRQKKVSKTQLIAQSPALAHTFVEGPEISIADVILFPYFWLMQSIFTRQHFNEQLPLTLKWIESLKNHSKITGCVHILSEPATVCMKYQHINYTVENSEPFTLYKRETRRNKCLQRMYTRNNAIEQSLSKIRELNIEITSTSSSSLSNSDENSDSSDWDLPFDALPEGGNLPENRLKRKKDQLFSLAREVIAIAKDGDRIVDFCSGQGHLAIILAYKLPQCLIYVLDNKDESLQRARMRVNRLNLTNIKFFQCNLDYFKGDFEIGTSLHACGIATDIVLMHCKQRHASFVCCPCCYGNVTEMPHIKYPRSECFRNGDITLDDYLCIAHCADQGHEIKANNNNVEKCIQGHYCMDVIDTDRSLYMMECGYNTRLTRLSPEDCTPKNRLLIGTKK